MDNRMPSGYWQHALRQENEIRHTLATRRGMGRIRRGRAGVYRASLVASGGPVALPDLTRDWALALQDHVSQRIDRPAPPGWLTTKGIADLLKITPPHASKLLSSMVKAGKAEMKKFSSPVQVRHTNALTAYGPRRAYTRLTPFFRLIKKR